MSWEEVEERGLESTMLRLKSEDKVLVNYLVDDKVTKKTKRIVKANLSPDRLEAELEDVAKNAHRQIDFIQLLMQLAEDESIDMKVLREDYGVTSAVVNRGVEKQWCRIEEVELYRDPYQDSNIAPTESLELNSEQKAAFDAINKSIESEEHDVFLLQGITGSGKTEVYLQTIAEVLEKEKEHLY